MGRMFGIMVYGNYIGQMAGYMSLMKRLNTGIWWFVNGTAYFYTDLMASLEEVTRGHDLNSEIVDFPRGQLLGTGVSVEWLPRL